MIGREVAVPHHQKDGDELTTPIAALTEHGRQLFSANWTDQDGGGLSGRVCREELLLRATVARRVGGHLADGVLQRLGFRANLQDQFPVLLSVILRALELVAQEFQAVQACAKVWRDESFHRSNMSRFPAVRLRMERLSRGLRTAGRNQ